MFHKLQKFTLQTIAGANIATSVLMVLIGYVGHLDPAHFPMLANAGLAFPLFIVINLAFLIFWVFVKFRYVVIPFLTFLVCYIPVRDYCPLNADEAQPRGALKVLTFNVCDFNYEFAILPAAENPAVKYIYDSQADIVCLQEATVPENAIDSITAFLRPRYPYSSHDRQKANGEIIIVYSRYPIASKEVIPYTTANEGNVSCAYNINIHGHCLLLVNNHFQSNRINPTEKNNFRNIIDGKLTKDSARVSSSLLINKLAVASRLRGPQVDAVARYIAHNRDGKSVIVCGDFNESPIAYSHTRLTEHLTDCFVASGRGFGWSFRQNHINVRIDNILCSDDSKPYRCTVDNSVKISDHFPVFCWIKTPFI